MKKLAKKLAMGTALSLTLTLQALAADPAFTLNVWPSLPPGDKTNMGTEDWQQQGTMLRGVVATPTLAVYRPAKEKDTGAAVLICPGGGFYQLSMAAEGWDVAQYFSSIGVTGILLKYRIPYREGMPHNMAAFQDAQRSMSIIRSKAAEWGIDPHRIGILGFSAGGQMAADVETNFDIRAYEPIDEIDKVDTRPDFAVLIYPGGIKGPAGTTQPSEDVHVSKNTPPTFLAISHDDRGGSENAVYMYLALKQAGVSAELHVFSEGGHGYGIRPGTAPHTTWPLRMTEWMRYRKIIPAAPK